MPAAGDGPGILDLDTGLTQLNRAWDNSSIAEPGFSTPSRIQVVPLAPTAAWASLGHFEPFFSTITNTIHVVFSNAGSPPATVNALFWDPHTSAGPGRADPYDMIR